MNLNSKVSVGWKNNELKLTINLCKDGLDADPLFISDIIAFLCLDCYFGGHVIITNRDHMQNYENKTRI